MQWISPFSLSALAILTAATTAFVVSRRLKWWTSAFSASLAECSTRLSALEQSARSTSSTLVESAELRDAIEKGNELLKRVNQREIMRQRRASIDLGTSKDDLRRAAGLIAGKPAPHR